MCPGLFFHPVEHYIEYIAVKLINLRIIVGSSEDDACHLPCLILTALTLSMTVTLSMMLTLMLAPLLSI
jgi:hypothetical protein